MAQRNDDELASYLAALLNPFGQISDQERLWYLTELNIAQPYLGAEHMNDLWMAYWLSKGIPQGSVNDMAYNWLISIGIQAGHINDMWHAYFEIPAYPPILDTALVWLDNTTIQDTAGAVTNWANKGTGGAGYDLNQILGVAGGIVVGALNGLRTVSSNGSASYMETTTTMLIPAPFTFFAVMRMDLTASQLVYLFDAKTDSGSTDDRFLAVQRDDANVIKVQYGIVGGNPTGYARTILPHKWYFENTGAGAGNGTFSIDNQAPQVITTGANFDWLTLFANRVGGNVVDVPTDMCEYVIIPSLITAQERIDIRTYFQTKWGF